MEAKILNDTVNMVVVHVPGRSFPGIVLQGDRLHWIVNRLTLASQLSGRHNDTELSMAINEAKGILEALYDHYTTVCHNEKQRGDW